MSNVIFTNVLKEIDPVKHKPLLSKEIPKERGKLGLLLSTLKRLLRDELGREVEAMSSMSKLKKKIKIKHVGGKILPRYLEFVEFRTKKGMMKPVVAKVYLELKEISYPTGPFPDSTLNIKLNYNNMVKNGFNPKRKMLFLGQIEVLNKRCLWKLWRSWVCFGV